MRKFITDGNPKLFKSTHLSSSAFVNEASLHPPNCVFVTNPIITKESIIEAYTFKTKLVSSLLLVPFDLKKGTELFTMYGSGYNSRGYKQWRDRNGFRDNLIEESHRIVNENVDELKILLLNNN